MEKGQSENINIRDKIIPENILLFKFNDTKQ